MADKAKTIVLEVQRYSPEHDAEPRFERFEVPLHKEWVVLDALNHIKDQVDGSLTYRWSCRMGICGSCGMMVNGEPKLTCATFLTDYAPGPIRVEALRYFPVVRDLVTEMSDFMAKMRKVQPWLVRHEEKPVSEGEYKQTPSQVADYKQFSMCINCTLCYAACPVYGLDAGFVGPAALALAQRYNFDSRDQGAQERMDILQNPEGVWGCTFVGECTRVCPKHVDPAGAIQRYKISALTDWALGFVMPKAKDSKKAEESKR
jgi:fumarate reductase iron-sulfur subunit